jgi:DNA-binding MarR family transcriptional regulator
VDERELSQALVDWSGVFLRVTMRDMVRRSRDEGLSLPQLNVLLHLHYRGPVEVLQLADDMMGSPSGASQMVERLVKGGLVARVEADHDRRVRMVRLTDRGLEVVSGVLEARQAWLASLAQSLTAAQCAQVGSALAFLSNRAAELERSTADP